MHRMSNIIDQFCVFGRNRVALVNDMPSTRLLVTRLVQRKAAEEFPLGDFGFEPLAKYRESLSSRNLLSQTFPTAPISIWPGNTITQQMMFHIRMELMNLSL